ncbi:type III secretion protein HrpB4 [Paraburkholderia sp. BCC1886]|uniref:type III secretion protein HrpB4 n=1 Tax=Paraburkholderia sp. BCC1886 TaxID=2562670 RepID=UPI001183A44C|nr:type III secretion protein HrpB4 [Paraburkholderia sp. BCC1886]
MSTLADSPYQRTAAALSAWQRNVRGLMQWAHPSWLAAALSIDEQAAALLVRELGRLDETDARANACSQALLRSIGASLPTLDALAQPGAARLDAMLPASGLQVLRLRALRFRRGEIRRIVDKRTRAQVAQWAGMPMERLGGDLANERTAAPDIAQMAARVPIPPVAMLAGEALALEGYALLKRDLRSTRSPCPLLRMALPRHGASKHTGSTARSHWVTAIPADVDQGGTARLFTQLPHLLPEWAWLFG